MYKIPKDIDLSEIIGHAISQWCLSRYFISFNIGQVVFGIESMMTFEFENKTIAQWWGNQALDYEFYEALDKIVVDYDVENLDALLIKLEGGYRIRLMDISNDFESFKITTSKHEYII